MNTKRKTNEHGGCGLGKAALVGVAMAVLANALHAAAPEACALADPGRNEQRICLSLKMLGESVGKALRTGGRIPDECLNLGGICLVEGYMIDLSGTKDVIIFGLKSKNRPSLRLDDLVANTRCQPGEYPYCSLDPKPANVAALLRYLQSGSDSMGEPATELKRILGLMGPQQTVVGGVPRNSREAHVMIGADYEMKAVSVGRKFVEGVVSAPDRCVAEAKAQAAKGIAPLAAGGMMSRFWFHIEEGQPSFVRGTDIVAIDRCRMVVLTERQLASASGELSDAVGKDPHAEAFAREFSDYLNGPAVERIYADLENLFRIRALVLALAHDRALEQIGSSRERFLKAYTYRDEKPMAASLPPLGDYRKIDLNGGRMTLIPFAFGGVGMDMTVGDKSFRQSAAPKLTSLQAKILATRPRQDSLVWLVGT